ncbi:hypothetical protein HYH02_003845 [Chlamydomonas schloesseri]|uniref:Protein kinase domain-containing protein n=1 Tax=Chlamydomonas schloesseri TaxID=2026947 RepID=A0A836B955_9CHLO|nr:hypothetical protein HYH02_003845 [Chlamydomonas schloesseri]|eukprot:KAG2451238.1 hypothetical protein HYH02_003845 [Chlamydomonas schloesseri]
MQAYELIGRLGAGANSTVYKCKNESGAIVAVKKLDGHHTPVAQIVQEAAVMRTCAHKHTVELVAVYQAEGTGSVYLVMEQVEHCLSRELLLNPRGLPLPRAKLIIYQLAQALERMHSQQWVHADLKPGNILLTGALSSVKLCDFGSATSPLLTVISTSDTADAAASTPPPPATTAAASRWYCAPESLLGGNATPASDMWALGCILGELLTGKPLMPGSEEELDQLCWVTATVGQLAPGQEALLTLLPPEQRARVEAARARGPLLDKIPKVASNPALGEVLRACLNPDPALRPTAAQLQAHAFFDDLRAALAAAAAAATAAASAASKPSSCDGSGSDGDGSGARRRSSTDGGSTAMDIDTPSLASAAVGTGGSASVSPDESAPAAAAGQTLASAGGATAAAAAARPARRVGGVQAAVRPAPRPRVSALTATIRGRGPFEGDGAYFDLMPAVLRLAARWEAAMAEEGKGPIALAARSTVAANPLATACSGELPLAPQALGTSFSGCSAGGGSAAGTSVGGASAGGVWGGFGSVGAGGGSCTSAGVIAAAAAAGGSVPGAPSCMTPIAAAAGGFGSAPRPGAVAVGTSIGGGASTAPSPMQCTPAAVPASAASPPTFIAAPTTAAGAASTTDPLPGIPTTVTPVAAAASQPADAPCGGAAAGHKAPIPISSSVGHVPYLTRVSRLAAPSSGVAAGVAYDSPMPSSKSVGCGAGGAAATGVAGSLPSFSLSPAQLRSRAIVNRARRHAAGSGSGQQHHSGSGGTHFHHQHQLQGEFAAAAAAAAGSPRAGGRGGGGGGAAGLGASATLLQQELHRAQQPHHSVHGGRGHGHAGRPAAAAAAGLGGRPPGHATRRSFADLTELASVSEVAPLACGGVAEHDTKRLRRVVGAGDEAAGAGGSLGAGSLLSCELGSLSSLPEHAQFLGSAEVTTPGGAGGSGSGAAPRRRMRRSSSGTGMALQQYAFGAAGVVLLGAGGVLQQQAPPQAWRPEALGRSQPIAMKPRVGGGGASGFRVLVDSPSTELNNNSGASELYLQEEVA